MLYIYIGVPYDLNVYFSMCRVIILTIPALILSFDTTNLQIILHIHKFYFYFAFIVYFICTSQQNTVTLYRSNDVVAM